MLVFTVLLLNIWFSSYSKRTSSKGFKVLRKNVKLLLQFFNVGAVEVVFRSDFMYALSKFYTLLFFVN